MKDFRSKKRALHCRRFYNAAGVAFRSPGFGLRGEDPEAKPWVSRPTFPERCRRFIPSGVIAFLMDGDTQGVRRSGMERLQRSGPLALRYPGWRSEAAPSSLALGFGMQRL